MNFVLIINVASYKVFPLADAMKRGDNEFMFLKHEAWKGENLFFLIAERYFLIAKFA
jgi:hypothetical protein